MIKTEYRFTAPVELSIALVTDLHEHDPKEVLSLLKKEDPDVIAVAGDLFERHCKGENLDRGDTSLSSRIICRIINFLYGLLDDRRREMQNIGTKNSYRFLREASEIAPIVMSLGNHELYLTEEDRNVIRETKTELLQNRTWTWMGVIFGGLDSKQGTGILDRKFLNEFSERKGYKILLCHHPEYYPELKSVRFHLMLSGHCHGGQIRLFNRGLFAPGQGFFPKFHHGRYGRMIVSAGTANTASVPRFGNPTEVVMIRLKKESGTVKRIKREKGKGEEYRE